MLKPILWMLSLLVVIGIIVFGAEWAFPEFTIFLESLSLIEAYAFCILVGGTIGIAWMKLYERFVE